MIKYDRLILFMEGRGAYELGYSFHALFRRLDRFGGKTMRMICEICRAYSRKRSLLWLFVTAPLAFFACGAGGAACVDDLSISHDRPRSHLPTDRESLSTQSGSPIKGTLPLGIGAQVNLFLSEADEQIDGFIDNVVKPMRKGEVFAAKPYQIDYAIRDRGDAFRNDVALDRVSFRSHYDIRVGMTRKFHNFGDLLDPGFWLGVGRFTPSPTNRGSNAPKPFGPLISMEESMGNDAVDWHLFPDRPLIDMDDALGRKNWQDEESRRIRSIEPADDTQAAKLDD